MRDHKLPAVLQTTKGKSVVTYNFSYIRIKFAILTSFAIVLQCDSSGITERVDKPEVGQVSADSLTSQNVDG